jgi:hypothetical protein
MKKNKGFNINRHSFLIKGLSTKVRSELDIEKAQWHKTRLGVSFCPFHGGKTSFSLSFETHTLKINQFS